MAKRKFKATWRVGDVFDVADEEGRELSHSLAGLKADAAHLEGKGTDDALAHLDVLKDKIKAIEAAQPAPNGAPAADEEPEE